MSEAGHAERWLRLSELFNELVDLSAAARAARLAELGAGDPALRSDLERLLAEVEDPGVLDAPAVEAFSALLESVDPAEPEEVLGQRVGPYRIVEELGRGGMGVVYLAERADGQFEQRVALKLVKRGLDTDEVLARFRRERQILARLEHQAIARLYDGGATEDGRPYFAMEFVEGEPVTAYCDAHALPIEERLQLFRRVCEAVEHAHRNQVVHRDLKPSNILVTESKDLKLLDFGVAKFLSKGTEGHGTPTLTRISSRPMTPEYAAPEQVLGQPVSPATDVYALGIVLYELLSGRRPYRLAERSETEVQRTILEVEPPRPSAVVELSPGGEDASAESLAKARGTTPAALRRRLAGDLDAIVLTALRKEPNRRYGSAQAFADDVERHLAGKPVKARPEAPFYRAGKYVRRNWGAVAAVGLMALAGASILYLLARVQTSSDTAAARDEPSIRAEPRLRSRRLTAWAGPEAKPTWSPDGESVAFTSAVSGNLDIWIKSANGGDAIQLTHDPAEDDDPHWSPDGSKIVFRSTRQGGGLFVMSAAGGEATQLTDFGYRPRWSPDGRRLLFQTRPALFADNEVWAMDYPEGSPQVLLGRESGKDPYRHADWSADGTFIVCKSGGFVEDVGLFVQPLEPPASGFFLEWEGQRIRGANPVWLSAPAGIVFTQEVAGEGLGFVPIDASGRAAGPTVQITTGGEDDAAISRDGRRLAYNGGAASQADLWRVAMSPTTGLPVGAPVRITLSPASETSPKVMPDNQHLLFLSDRDGGWFLYASDLDGRNVKVLDRTHRWARVRAVSPDGQWLVLYGRELDGSPFRSYRLPFDPTTLEVMGPAVRFADAGQANSFSPDGRYLLANDPLETAAGLEGWMNPTSSEPVEVRWHLRPDFLEEYPRLLQAFFSPDGGWVAFGAYKQRHRPAVFVLPQGSDTPALLWEGSGYAYWTHDPRRVYIWSERGDHTQGRLGFVEFDPATGAAGAFRFLNLPGLLNPYEYALTPDLRWLYFSLMEYDGDIVVADLVHG